MKHLLSLLLTAIFCASASAQTIRTLGYNSTNGNVVANTGTNAMLTFTNEVVRFASGDLSISNQSIVGTEISFSFEDGSFDAGGNIVREQLGFSTNLNTLWTATNASNARSAVGLSATWLTNTNVTNFRTAIGLGVTNDVALNSVTTEQLKYGTNTIISLANQEFYVAGSQSVLSWTDNEFAFEAYLSFNSDSNRATTRTNLNLGLPALTNTSNVTMMRALSGSTNTNHPYSGSISVVGTNNTNTLVFSNGILQSVQ